METQSSGTEVRRLHIIYFLSRKGRIEHPHLIRLHHLSRNGVRLRDIKRWLAEIRGKDMPDSFSWSYKRRYKTGYVWQDLVDDDLITPISDNEYVLKGSEISSTTIREEKAEQQQDQKMQSREESQSHSSETSVYVSTKSSSCEIEEESTTFGSESSSTLTDDSVKADTAKISSATKHSKEAKMESNKDKKRSKKVTISEQISTNDSSSKKSSMSSEAKSKSSSSNGASNMLRNLITCGAVETNDSAVVAVNKQNNNTTDNNKPFLNMCPGDLENVHSAEIICKRDRLGGSQRVFGNPNWTQQKQSSRKSFDGVNSAKSKSESRDQTVSYKTVNWPNCSQCGKPFKPEKLHSHMKSCKGMKALSKEAAAISAEKGSRRSVDLKSRDSVSSHLLTQ